MSQPIGQNTETAANVEQVKAAFLNHLTHTVGKPLEMSSRLEQYFALAHGIRERLMDQWVEAIEHHRNRDTKVVSYLSAEYLPGPHLMNALQSLGATEICRTALKELGVDLDALATEEPEPGLGNGGLGRLASCFMDSMASLDVPAVGYGLRYEFGIFRQEIRDGWQVERSDKWLQFGNPWEIVGIDSGQEVCFGGHTETFEDAAGSRRWRWVPAWTVRGVPYDTPIPGYSSTSVNRIRLWKAEAMESFDLTRFNAGDYMGAVREKMQSETISKVLYPSDESDMGKYLRLAQQYFFTSCSLQDMLRIHKLQGKPIQDFHEKWAIQLNDTHPSIGIAELMRLLVDVEELDWESAWQVTQKTFAYTNHTLLPEALERWPIRLFGELLPRHLEIIYEINQRFLDLMRHRFPGDEERIRRMSLIGEDGEKTVRMAHLAVVGSHSINGVAELHSRLLREQTLHHFYEAFPNRFNNKTNGVTPRRWLMLADPGLCTLIDETIGTDWQTDLDGLRALETFAEDTNLIKQWRETQESAKSRLAAYIHDKLDITVDPQSCFDIQVKRIHEYKRQHLNALHILSLYCRMKADSTLAIPSRTFIFGGKAAPSYAMAKLMIKLITSVGDVVNNDPDVKDRLKVVFLPDYNVSLGQLIYPAADLSEQISTAGKEASGTGCMKFQMNGAVTIGTLDGANVEIREEVGEENFFLFGLTAQQIEELTGNGYRPRDFYESNPLLREVLDGLLDGRFSHGDRALFNPLVNELLTTDRYFVLADFDSYANVQSECGRAYEDVKRWGAMSILNTARSGKFSSDRTIREYCNDIWGVPVTKVFSAPVSKPKTKRAKRS